MGQYGISLWSWPHFSISGFGDDMKLTVLFNDGVRRKLMAKFANLKTEMLGVMLSSELVQKIASLARLKLSDEETESLTVQLDSILEYISS